MPTEVQPIYSCDICGRKWRRREEAETCEEIHRLLVEIGEKGKEINELVEKRFGRQRAQMEVNKFGEAAMWCEAENNLPEIVIWEDSSRITPEPSLNSGLCEKNGKDGENEGNE